jgi:hypothetical protein
MKPNTHVVIIKFTSMIEDAGNIPFPVNQAALTLRNSQSIYLCVFVRFINFTK